MKPGKTRTPAIVKIKAAPTKIKSAKIKTAPTKVKTAPVKKAAAKKVVNDPARVTRIMAELEKLYPDAHCELDFGSPFQLLVATILSAQCTDKRVNMVTPALFARFPDAVAMAKATQGELEEMVKTTGFFRNKAKNILGAARVICDEFDGQVPKTMDELLTLPGVARKTANVVLGTAFGINAGFVVDTHIGRLSNRLALSAEEDPVKVEVDLCAIIPQPKWTKLGHQLIFHGRRVCDARKPDCVRCTLIAECPSAMTVA